LKLTKFPVTSPSGNDYRVTITLGHSVWHHSKYLVSVYVKREGFLAILSPFKSVGEYKHRFDDGIPDYIAVASDVIRYHEEQVAEEMAKTEAEKAFAVWDGVITKTNEEGANGSR
jgi:hypothetical protein